MIGEESLTTEQLIFAPYGSDTINKNFAAPRPLMEALTAHARERGVSVSFLVRESLVRNGIVPPGTTT